MRCRWTRAFPGCRVPSDSDLGLQAGIAAKCARAIVAVARAHHVVAAVRSDVKSANPNATNAPSGGATEVVDLVRAQFRKVLRAASGRHARGHEQTGPCTPSASPRGTRQGPVRPSPCSRETSLPRWAEPGSAHVKHRRRQITEAQVRRPRSRRGRPGATGRYENGPPGARCRARGFWPATSSGASSTESRPRSTSISPAKRRLSSATSG